MADIIGVALAGIFGLGFVFGMWVVLFRRELAPIERSRAVYGQAYEEILPRSRLKKVRNMQPAYELETSEEEFIDEFRNLIKGLLAEGARIPKELMLFVKIFAYLSSVMQELDPEMDLLQEFLEVASSFFGKNGVRVATEIGFSLGADDVSDATFRRVAGIRDTVSTLTWKELGERRSSLLERMDRRSNKKIIH